MTDVDSCFSTDDETFALLLAEACPRAWSRMELRHGATVRRSIARVVGRFPGLCCSDTVDEVHAELTIRLLKNRGAKLRAFKSGRGLTLEQWLMRIGKQAAFDHVRRMRRRRTTPLQFDIPVASDHDPHAECLGRERSQLLERALAVLPPRERQLYELCIAGQEDPERAAAQMGIRVATVYSKKHKLMARLSRVLSDEARLAA
ncbi:MAG: sigma-70 family RNA polymerase sigma factor [Polyangiaceae bacterium]